MTGSLLAVVETNALFSKNSIRPVISGVLPLNIQNLVLRHVYNQETILQSVLKEDKNQIFNVFINDPLTGNLNLE